MADSASGMTSSWIWSMIICIATAVVIIILILVVLVSIARTVTALSIELTRWTKLCPDHRVHRDRMKDRP